MKRLNWVKHPEIEQRMDELIEQGLSFPEIADLMTSEFNRPFTSNQLQKRTKNRKSNIIMNIADELDYNPKLNIVENSNGINITGDVFIDEDVPITGEFLMGMFGYDTSEFEVMSSSSTVWDAPTVGSKQKMYRCKLTVRRKVVPMSISDLQDVVNSVESVLIEPSGYNAFRDDGVCVVPIYDKHFGISDLTHYKNELRDIIETLEIYGNDAVVIALGGDLFHNDSIIHGTTTKGTQIDKVNMFKAIEDFTTYISTIIETSLFLANDVHVVSVAGNHDTTVGFLVTEMIKVKYPQCHWYTPTDESQLWRKAILINDVMLGFAHGDKATNNIDRVFSNEFPYEWGNAKTRDIYIGHLHSKRELQVMTENRDGVTIRRMPSANKLDNYHIQHGYTSAIGKTVVTYYENGVLNMERHI